VGYSRVTSDGLAAMNAMMLFVEQHPALWCLGMQVTHEVYRVLRWDEPQDWMFGDSRTEGHPVCVFPVFLFFEFSFAQVSVDCMCALVTTHCMYIYSRGLERRVLCLLGRTARSGLLPPSLLVAVVWLRSGQCWLHVCAGDDSLYVYIQSMGYRPWTACTMPLDRTARSG
jgi:hypothetical protein